MNRASVALHAARSNGTATATATELSLRIGISGFSGAGALGKAPALHDMTGRAGDCPGRPDRSCHAMILADNLHAIQADRRQTLIGQDREGLAAPRRAWVPERQSRMRVRPAVELALCARRHRLLPHDRHRQRSSAPSSVELHPRPTRDRHRAGVVRRHAQMAASACDDGKEVETVYIPEEDRGTLCISSQVGCTLTCSFCHTGTQRLVRNLTAGEIVGQIMVARDRPRRLAGCESPEDARGIRRHRAARSPMSC